MCECMQVCLYAIHAGLETAGLKQTQFFRSSTGVLDDAKNPQTNVDGLC